MGPRPGLGLELGQEKMGRWLWLGLEAEFGFGLEGLLGHQYHRDRPKRTREQRERERLV